MSSPIRNDLTPREKIIKARIELLRAHPFWGTMAMHLRPIELTGEDIQKEMGDMPTIAVDEFGNMPYSADFIKTKTLEEVMFYVAHETMHVALEHIWRIGSRDPMTANIAADFAANYLLGEEMQIPQGVLGYQDDKYKGKSFEEIYEELVKQGKKYSMKFKSGQFDKMIPSKGNKCPKCGGSGKLPNGSNCPNCGGQGQGPSGAGSGKLSPFWKPGQTPIDPTKMVKDAINFAKNQGHLPAGMERVFKDYFTTGLNWKEMLLKYIQEVLPKDFTYMKPGKRFCSTGVYFPAITKQEIEIYVGVDSSGSISDEEYSIFLSEIYQIISAFENVKGTMIVCDAAIGAESIVDIDQTFDPTQVHGKGYGGTSCLPVFKWIKDEKEERIKLLIYFTDGYIDEPNEEVYSGEYPVLWVITKAGRTDFLQQNIGKQMVIQMDEGRGRDDD